MGTSSNKPITGTSSNKPITGTSSNKPIIIQEYRVMRCSPVDCCFFICLRMKRTEEELVKLLDIKDRGLRIVANLDASGVSKDLLVQFVDDGCLLDTNLPRHVVIGM